MTYLPNSLGCSHPRLCSRLFAVCARTSTTMCVWRHLDPWHGSAFRIYSWKLLPWDRRSAAAARGDGIARCVAASTNTQA